MYLIASGLILGGSSTVHIYTQTIHSVCHEEGVMKLRCVMAVCLQTWTEVAILLNRLTIHRVVTLGAVAVLSRAITRCMCVYICRPVFRYFTSLGPRKFCAPPPPYLFIFSYVFSV
jgi:hypothetical protein